MIKKLSLLLVVTLLGTGCASQKSRMSVEMLGAIKVDCEQSEAAQRFFEWHRSTPDERMRTVLNRNTFNAIFDPDTIEQGNDILARKYDAVVERKLDEIRKCPNALPFKDPNHKTLGDD